MKYGPARQQSNRGRMTMVFKHKVDGNTYQTGKRTGILQLLSMVCMILTIQIWQIHGFGRISIVVFLAGIIASLITSIIAVRDSIHGQLLVNTVISFILEASALAILFKNHYELKRFLGSGNFGIIWISLSLLAIIQVFQLAKAVPVLRIKKKNWKNIILIVIFIGILISISMQFLNPWPRWDSAAYYFEMKKLSAVNIFQNLNNGLIVAGHPTAAWVFLSFLFETIPAVSKLNALFFSNVFLMVLVFLLVYYILTKLLSFKRIYIYSILAFIFTVCPYILGAITNINPEHLCSVGILIFLVGFIQSNYFISFLACYIVCNTRETGLPIIAALIFIQLLYDLYQAKKNKSKITSVNLLYYISTISIGISWLMIFSNINWSQGMSADYQLHYVDGTRMFKFGISPQYIINQVKGIFLTNFMWIYLIIIIIGLVLYVKRNKKTGLWKKLLLNKPYVMILIGMIVSIVEICLFLTHHNFRYYTQSVLFIQLAGILSFAYITSRFRLNEFLKTVPIFIIGLLLLIQCYTTIDPLMLSIFPTISTGKGKLIAMPWKIDGLPDSQFLECANYNFQIPYFDKALDIAYSGMKLKDAKILIYDGYQWGELGNTLNSIWGYGYEYLTPPFWGVWNNKGQYRELSNDRNNAINPIPVKKTSEVQKYLKNHKNVYYIELPWGDKLIDSLKSKYENMQALKAVRYHGWVLKVYKMQ